ncbi:MAG: maleylpyruvate isomerase N-terminal domain-containing protein [Streptosporangiaceae bacterium]
MTEPTAPHAVESTIGRITEASDRLTATVSALSDDQVREPSLLPGWSRGHVLTHIARNADGLRNLLIWAETGVETPQYASLEDRDGQIESGAGRPSHELAADVSESSNAFLAKARELTDDAWTAEVRGFRGPAHPGWFTLQRRLTEVEIHHVDLAAGYGPADWPDWFVTDMLYRVTGQLWANPDTPKAMVTDSDTGRQFFLRQDASADLEVTGPGAVLLAWLLGRDDGASLSADPQGQLPSIPPY